MYGKGKANNVPSDAQAREKLAMYVYEYLLHVGAGKAAHTFLQEIGWEKNISLGESPGFLHSWWCVFWDLYCASPERRDTCEHSSEAKAFHDYSAATAPSPLNPIPPDGMGQPGLPPGYFPPGSAASPSPHHNPNNHMMRQQPYMSPRYPPGGPRPGMQGPGPQQMMGMERPGGQMMPMSRMVHPRGIPPGAMNPSWGGPEQFQQPFQGMRMPASTMPGHSGIPMNMHGRSPWPNPSGPGPVGPPTGGPPGNQLMRSPQDQMNSDFMGKPLPHQQMPSTYPVGQDGSLPPTSIPMSGGPPMSVSTPNMVPPLNGMNGSGPDSSMMEGMPKSSPSNNMPMNSMPGPGAPQMGPPGGPGGTPHTPQEGDENAFGMVPFNENDHNESAAILKIKENMEQEAKRFEAKDGEGNGATSAANFGFMSSV